MIEFVLISSIILTLSSTAFISWNKLVKKNRAIEAKNHLAFLFQAQETYRLKCGHYYPSLDILEAHATGAIPQGKLIYNIGGKQGGTDFTSITTRCNEDQYKCTGATSTDCKTDLSTICKTLSEFQTDNNVPCYFDKNPGDIPGFIGDTTKFTQAAKDKVYPAPGLPTPHPRGDGYSITNEDFLLFAIGRLGSSDDIDGWVIDENKVLTHFQQGY